MVGLSDQVIYENGNAERQQGQPENGNAECRGPGLHIGLYHQGAAL